MNGLIYSAMTPDNQMYIGKTTLSLKKRISRHNYVAKTQKRNIGLGGSINYFGKNNIRWGVIMDGIQNNTALANYERFYIQLKDTYNNGLNLTELSCGATGHTKEFKDRMSVRMSGSNNCRWVDVPSSSIGEYIGGMSMSKIAMKYNCSTPTIRRYLVDNGITIRTSVESQCKFTSDDYRNNKQNGMYVGTKMWITNGSNSKFVDVSYCIPIGYWKGRTK